MKLTVVQVPSIATPVKESPGFFKKQLADYKLDIMGRCEFQCSYCSSCRGNYLRINSENFADATEAQTGVRRLHTADPTITFQWIDFEARLDEQLSGKSKLFGEQKVLVFSQLTDAFSPTAVASGLTMRTLVKILEKTSFRIRVLTKSAIVGTEKWIAFFKAHPERFVVGLSIGTLDDRWARAVEVGTSSPTARVKALRRLQDAGVPTFGMLCPIFPDALNDEGVERLVAAIRPDRCETVWSEPYNDRGNWRAVAAGYAEGDSTRTFLASMFEGPEARFVWSAYAVALYQRVHAALGAHSRKHRYLLYQGSMPPSAIEALRRAQGVLFQSKEAAPPPVSSPKQQSLPGLDMSRTETT